jgi:hypothetical protein
MALHRRQADLPDDPLTLPPQRIRGVDEVNNRERFKTASE